MSVPNQKHIVVHKEKCDGSSRDTYYTSINLNALEAAALDLDAGAFKLWIYFAKNQNNYEFDLSNKAVELTFGMKIKQYNNAVAQLIAKKYLVNIAGNIYVFNEIPVITKEDNAVITKSNNAVITLEDNELLPKDIRNITNNITDNTLNREACTSPPSSDVYNTLAESDGRAGIVPSEGPFKF